MFAEGAVVGEYTLQRKVGQGPLAEVWRAKKSDRTEPTALKVLRPGALPPSDMRRGFDRLVTALSQSGRLEHPHLPPTLGTVRRPSDGLFGVASPYYDGGPLFDAGDLTHPSALYDALELVIQLGQTVMWLHDQGVVHGAIKPSNVLASPSANGPSIRLLDLCWSRAGLCRLEGTRFEPPELKNGPATEASDQWAVARLVRVLVARRAAEPIGAWARAPADLRHAVDKSLSPDPGQRFDRVAQLVDALVTAQAGISSNAPTAAHPQTLPSPTVPVPPDRRASPPDDPIDPAALGDAPTETALEEDAPTQPALGESEPVAVRPPAKASPPPDNTKTADHLDGIGINPSADSNDPSNLVRPVPEPGDPTYPLPPEDSPRGLSLPLIVVAAALATGGLYAWSIGAGGSTDPASRTATVGDYAAPPPLETPPPPSASEAATPAEPPSPTAETAPTAPPPPPAAPPSPVDHGTVDRPNLATASERVDGEAKDHAWAECVEGVLNACIALAKQHEQRRYWRGAAKAREQACLRGDRASCITAGQHFVKSGNGRAARRQFERLCDNRDGRACAELSVLFEKGIGGRRSPRTARAFLDRACQLGYSPSCR